MINLGWQKLEKYYRLSDRTPAYAASIVLHLWRKWKWIDIYWNTIDIVTTKASVLNLWHTEYRLKPQPIPPPPQAV
jgi:hypothetical protein